MSNIADITKDEIETIFGIIITKAPPELQQKIVQMITKRVHAAIKKATEGSYGPVAKVVEAYCAEIVNAELEKQYENIRAEVQRQMPLRMEKLKAEAIEAAFQAAVIGIAEGIKKDR